MIRTKPIKVDKKIKTLRIIDRAKVQLIVGNDYYVSFGPRGAYPCKLIKILDQRQILIKMPCGQDFLVFDDEIGVTPDNSVNNCVTN